MHDTRAIKETEMLIVKAKLPARLGYRAINGSRQRA